MSLMWKTLFYTGRPCAVTEAERTFHDVYRKMCVVSVAGIVSSSRSRDYV